MATEGNRPTDFVLELYISGRTPKSERAIERLRRMCDRELGDAYTLMIIDVIERPDKAMARKIIATPTLIRVSPPPSRWVIGDLEPEEKVAAWLGLDPLTRNAPRREKNGND